MEEIEFMSELYNKFRQNYKKSIEENFPNVRNMDKGRPFYAGWGCNLDIQTAREISELNILDSMEEGIMLEKKYPNIVFDRYKLYHKDSYEVVGEILIGDYVTLIEKMRQGLCDEAGLIESCSNSDTIDMIRYKDRDYGEIIRKYNLTLQGFFRRVMIFADED